MGNQKKEENPRPGKGQEKNQPKNNRGMMFRKGDEKKSTIPASSSNDWSSSSSENTAPSPKRIDVKRTPHKLTNHRKKTNRGYQKIHTKQTGSLGQCPRKPYSHKNVDQKKLSMNRREKTPKKKNKKKQPSSFSSFIHELGFKENSPEFIASIRFLE